MMKASTCLHFIKDYGNCKEYLIKFGQNYKN